MNGRLVRQLEQARTDLEAITPAPLEGPPSWWQEALNDVARQLFATMPESEQHRVYAALELGLDAWLADPVAFRFMDLALSAAPKVEPQWFPWSIRGWIGCRRPLPGPLSLPGVLCEALDRDPEAARTPYLDDCEVCAYELPRGLLDCCPVCSGRVGPSAYMMGYHHCLGRLQGEAWAQNARCVHRPGACPAEERNYHR